MELFHLFPFLIVVFVFVVVVIGTAAATPRSEAKMLVVVGLSSTPPDVAGAAVVDEAAVLYLPLLEDGAAPHAYKLVQQ